MTLDPESKRLAEDEQRLKNWKRWGPYLSDRQWGTVREDYSPDGNCWDYFPHDHARSRAYRWGEDGLLGITDRQCRVCFALGLWNERDPIIKERLFGLTGHEGNHGEDVKEYYYYLDSLPTHAYMKALYKYPQAEYPYAALVNENRARGRMAPEFELMDTGIFEGNRYFDVTAEYGKKSPDYLVVRLTIANRSKEAAAVHLLPQLWFRNSWSWGRAGEAYSPRPRITLETPTKVVTAHESFEPYALEIESSTRSTLHGGRPEAIFTENETNIERLFNYPLGNPYVKDGFHEYVVRGRKEAVNPAHEGTKAAFHMRFELDPESEVNVCLRFYSCAEQSGAPLRAEVEQLLSERKRECDQYYEQKLPSTASKDERLVMRQAYAGLLWTKQFYYYSVSEWHEGDPTQPAVAPNRKKVRNSEWRHLYNRDVISMPDKWEYPWYAAWDLAFHMIPFSRIDPDFAKQQLLLFLREWYMHPNGQIPAYEFAFSDVNPPVHAWACWRVYKISAERGKRDRAFLSRAFQKLLLNFTWWVNRKDVEGKNLFSGGFLGLDNIGVFDRGQPSPMGGHLEQADGTAWMAFYCGTMLAIALELAKEDPAYEDLASKFFEHFIAITDAINTLGGTGLWDQLDGFYYDQLHVKDQAIPLRVRSLVGIIPLLAVEVLEDHIVDRLPGFKKRMMWFVNHRQDLARHISYTGESGESSGHRLIAVPSKERLERMLKYVLNENEFLSPYGIRSLSRIHKDYPYVFHVGPETYRVDYDPGESHTTFFGGNSNWRGPVWYPINYLIIEALERYHHFYGDTFKVECPTGSGIYMNLRRVAEELSKRLSALFLSRPDGTRPCHGAERHYADDQHWKDLVLFYEYFHGDDGSGVGASHQTGWTALVTRCLEKQIAARR